MKIGSVLFLFVISAFGHELEFGNYLKIQEALATYEFKNALVGHKVICEKELGHYKENYLGCEGQFSDITALRESFKDLSKLYIGNGKSKELDQLQVVECSMAKAKWAQKKGEIKNPYYGKKMLSCGSKI